MGPQTRQEVSNSQLTLTLAAWGFGLGAELSSASMALFATGVWLATVALAVALERRGSRGPAETALRRLAYRPRSTPEHIR